MNGVVPITMKGRACDDHIREVGVRHFDADGIGTGIQLCPDREPGGGPHTPNELDHGFAIDERTPTPVLGDVTEEAVLDLVPLGGAGWKCETLIVRPVRVAKRCNATFHNRERVLLLPPASAVMQSSRVSGYVRLPIWRHHRAIDRTAKAGV